MADKKVEGLTVGEAHQQLTELIASGYKDAVLVMGPTGGSIGSARTVGAVEALKGPRTRRCAPTSEEFLDYARCLPRGIRVYGGGDEINAEVKVAVIRPYTVPAVEVPDDKLPSDHPKRLDARLAVLEQEKERTQGFLEAIRDKVDNIDAGFAELTEAVKSSRAGKKGKK